MRISLDTNVFVEVKNKEAGYESSRSILDWIDSGSLRCTLSTVVIAEMCAGYHLAGELAEKDDFLAHLEASQNYEIVGLSVRLADRAGEIKAAAGLRLPDAVIVAAADQGNADLLVSNDVSLRKAAKLIRVMTSREFVKERERKGKEGAG